MLRKKKNNENIISFYPFSEKSLQFAPPPMSATKNIPDWYKRQPGETNDKDTLSKGFPTSTIKRCMPIFDAMGAGYIIVAPCDIYLDATNPEKLVYSIPASLKQYQGDLFATHGRDQYSEYPINKDKYHKDLLRLMPFWAVGTQPGYSCLVINPIHRDESPLFAFSGLVDTDQFITDGHYSFLVEKDFKGIIKQGTPLVQIFPFKREPWQSYLATPEESMERFDNQRLKVRSSFINSYKNKFRAKKEFR